MTTSLQLTAETHMSSQTVDLGSPLKAPRDTSLAMHLANMPRRAHHTTYLLNNHPALSLVHTTASQPLTAIPIDHMTANPVKHMCRRPLTMRTRITVDAWSKYSASLVFLLQSLARTQTRIANAAAESVRFVRQSVKAAG